MAFAERRVAVIEGEAIREASTGLEKVQGDVKMHGWIKRVKYEKRIISK